MWNPENLCEIHPRYRLGLGLFSLVLVLLVGAPAVAAAQELERTSPADLESLVREVEAGWEVLPVHGGVVLKPLDPQASFRAVELSVGGIAVDGELVEAGELEARLGDRADLIRRLASRSPEELRSLFASSAEAGIPGEPAPLPPVEAPPPPRPLEKIRSGERVVFADNLEIAEDEVAREAVVIGGSLVLDGRVERDAAVIGGTAEINGEVGRDVVVVGGTLHLGPEARIGRNLQLVGSTLRRDEGAVIEGEISEVGLLGGLLSSEDFKDEVKEALREADFRPQRLRPWLWVSQVIWEIISLAIVGLLMCVVVLLGERGLGNIDARLALDPWKAAAVGFLTQVLFVFLLPLTLILLVISIVGIPLLLLVPIVVLAVVVAAFVGYTAAALRVGRLLESRFGWKFASPYAAVLAGLVVIQGWQVLAEVLDMRFLSFLAALIGVLAFLVCYVAGTAGFGALVLTWLERRRESRLGVPPSPPPLPPSEPEPGWESAPEGDEPLTEPR